MTKFLIANWKMNPQSLEESKEILKKVLSQNFSNKKIKTIVCPPVVWLKPLIDFSKNKIDFGSQNVFYKASGAFTGEISPKMLKNIGVKYVILGHSERREYLAEKDELIAQKLKAVLENNLIPILCVGENYKIRKQGIESSQKFILNQIKKDFDLILNNKKFTNKEIIIAYEPLWAISTSSIGIADNPLNAAKIINFIKSTIFNLGFKKTKVLYGGSVNSSNVLDFLMRPEISGALVGGASIRAEEFSKMIQILNKGLK
ncbi:MAG: triose-phosphate isomerase [Minisyncoccia bacterium]